MIPINEFTDTQILKELESRIKAKSIKVDWDDANDNYNEEETIWGLYTNDFNLNIYDLKNDFLTRKQIEEEKKREKLMKNAELLKNFNLRDLENEVERREDEKRKERRELEEQERKRREKMEEDNANGNWQKDNE